MGTLAEERPAHAPLVLAYQAELLWYARADNLVLYTRRFAARHINDTQLHQSALHGALCFRGRHSHGTVLALKPELHSGQEFAALIGLSAGFFSALAYSQVKELSRVGEPEWRIVFYFTLFGTVTGLIGHIATEGMLHPVRLNDLPGLLGIGITATLAQLSLTRAWGAGNVLLTSALQFSAIVFAAVLGLLFFSEPISSETALGIAVIITAGVSATVISRKKNQALNSQL